MVELQFLCCLSVRSQRLQFDVSSPNGILLFRETSKMITTYGACPGGVQAAWPAPGSSGWGGRVGCFASVPELGGSAGMQGGASASSPG